MDIFRQNMQHNSIENNPFQSTSKINRTPPQAKHVVIAETTEVTTKAFVEKTVGKFPFKTNEDEDACFRKLGTKIEAIINVVKEAKNIHKAIRENIIQAQAVYESLKTFRQMKNVAVQKSAELCEPKEQKSVATQTIKADMERKKRAASQSPSKPVTKKPRNLPANPESTEEILQEQNVEPNNWQTVHHGKQTKKKENQKSDGQTTKKPKGEAVSIKVTGNKTYADVLRDMKRKVNLSEIGVDVSSIRRSRTGDLLISLKKSNGSADKLKEALKTSLSADIEVKTLARKYLLDIRDMDESVENEEIIDALVNLSEEVADRSSVVIRNMRESYGQTKQALVEVPECLALKALKKRKIKIGWLLCRVKEKERILQCFRCLERGHTIAGCTGKDRRNLCKRCGEEGHKAITCQKDPRCVLCSEEGRVNIHHFIGSGQCENERQQK